MTKLSIPTFAFLAAAIVMLAGCQSDAARGIYVAPPPGVWDNYRN